MSERELLALMAAIIYAGDDAGECTMSVEDCVTDARRLLLEIDARELARRQPPGDTAP